MLLTTRSGAVFLLLTCRMIQLRISGSNWSLITVTRIPCTVLRLCVAGIGPSRSVP